MSEVPTTGSSFPHPERVTAHEMERWPTEKRQLFIHLHPDHVERALRDAAEVASDRKPEQTHT